MNLKTLNAIKHELSKEIWHQENYLEQEKDACKFYYRNADKQDPTSTWYFERLNECRDDVRQIQKKLKTLREAQKEVKAEIKWVLGK